MKILKFILLVFLILMLTPEKFFYYEPFIIYKIDKNIDKCYRLNNWFKNFGRLKKLYYRNGNRVIFFNNNGEIISKLFINSKDIIEAGIGERGLIIYRQNGENIFYLDKTGKYLWELKTKSYPFMSLNENLALMLTGENISFTLINLLKGEMLTNFISAGAFITSFAISSFKNLVGIGDIDGNVYLYNEKLNLVFSKNFNLPVVKKIAISPYGDYLAVLVGVPDETLYILNSKGKIIYSYKTKEDRRRPIEILFSKDSKYLLEESEEGFRVYSVKKRKILFEKKVFEKSNRRKIIDMDISRDGGFIILSYKFLFDDIAVVELYYRETMIYRLFFQNELPYVKFGIDNNIFLIETEQGIFVYGL